MYTYIYIYLYTHTHTHIYIYIFGFPGDKVVKNPPANAGETGDWVQYQLGRCPRGGNGNTLQYPCQGNPMDRGAWQATIHGVTKSQTQLSY